MALTTKISELPAKGSNLGTGDLVPIAEVDAGSPTGYTTKYVTGAQIGGGGGGGNTIYSADDTIVAARTVTIGTSLDFTGGKLDRTSANGRDIVEVIRASDLPSTLAANTTYIIRGQITFSTFRNITNAGSEIIGLDRTVDEMVYSGTGSFLRVTDVDFSIKNLRLSSTDVISSIIKGVNYTTGTPANNYGRTKVLQVFGCEFRNIVGDVLDCTGFELIDFNNCLFWYITGANGLRFKDVRHLEFSSCEMYNWFDEATGTTYSTASMIELQANGTDNQGFAVVNINSCIIHPEQTQTGLEIDPSSTTSFGTIAANTFIDVGITTGQLFLPVQGGLPDYTQTATYYYDIFSNQGLLNSTAGILMTMINNTQATTIASSGTPVQVDCGNNNSQQDRVRWSGSSGGVATYLGGKQVFVSIHATITFVKSGGGRDEFSFFIYKNGVQFANSHLSTGATNTSGTVTMTFACLAEQTNQLSWYVQNNTGTSNITITDWQIVIRE